ncbi:MAG: hypothetical protein F4214_02100 [Candidatus Dadabacteria bacterium]|nr:hypothetical protein [Candidatus Dadabacteria bacterium]
MMLIRRFRERWLNLARENGLLRFVVGALCVTVALQGCYMKKLSERTTVHVHVPEYMRKDFTLGAAGAASLSYTEQWALSLLPFVASFTAETVDFNVRQFLLYVHPESHHSISGFLLEKSKEIKASGVAQAFFPKTVAVLEEGAVVAVSGRRTRVVGNVVTDQREVSYRIRFELGAGNRPLVTELTEDEAGATADEP